MQPRRRLADLLVLGILIAAGHATPASGQAGSESAAPPAQASAGWVRPADLHPETGNRFPPIRRDALNEGEKKLYFDASSGAGTPELVAAGNEGKS